MERKELMAILLSMTLAAGMMTGCGAQKEAQPAMPTQT